MEKECTILITMHYSSIFIEKLLNYYDNQSLFEVILVDSTKDSINFKIPDFVNHLKVPNDTVFSEKMHQAISAVSTKYVVWNADDDFYSFDGIVSGINFLNDNTDYNSFYGQTIIYDGKFSIYTTKSYSINQTNPTQRLKYGFKNYDNRLNSVMRSSDALNFYELYCSNFKTPSFTFEFANAFYFLKKGKVKYSSTPFIFRRRVENSAGNVEFNYLKFWTENKYLKEKNSFIKLLAHKEKVRENLIAECLSIIYSRRKITYLVRYVLNQALLKLGFFKIKKHKAFRILRKESRGFRH